MVQCDYLDSLYFKSNLFSRFLKKFVPFFIFLTVFHSTWSFCARFSQMQYSLPIHLFTPLHRLPPSLTPFSSLVFLPPSLPVLPFLPFLFSGELPHSPSFSRSHHLSPAAAPRYEALPYPCKLDVDNLRLAGFQAANIKGHIWLLQNPWIKIWGYFHNHFCTHGEEKVWRVVTTPEVRLTWSSQDKSEPLASFHLQKQMKHPTVASSA